LGGSLDEGTPVDVRARERNMVSFDDEDEQGQEKEQERRLTKPTPAKRAIAQDQYASRKDANDISGWSEATIREQEYTHTRTNEKNSLGQHAKPDQYIEADDHIVIKEVKERRPDEVPLASIQPNPDQPRTNFKQEELEELCASITRDGLLQPILVRPVGEGYQIIAGERRWQACKKAGMKTVPVRVRDADDDKALELALVENIQRSDLNPIEEAYGYRRLMERRGLTQSAVAETVSKGRSTIANALRLLELPEDAQQLLFEEKISAGHARAILSIPTKEGRQKLTDRMLKEKISVREAEALARLFSVTHHTTEAPARVATPKSFKTVARALGNMLNTKVRVKTTQGRNKIEIEFKDEEELKRLFDRISTSETG
jgi:ParB family chromosome partitioning protein